MVVPSEDQEARNLAKYGRFRMTRRTLSSWSSISDDQVYVKFDKVSSASDDQKSCFGRPRGEKRVKHAVSDDQKDAQKLVKCPW